MAQAENMSAMTAISKAAEVDPVFAEVCSMLYGDAVDPREAYDIAKSMPDQASVATHDSKPKRRRKKPPIIQESDPTLSKAFREAVQPILQARRAGQIDTPTAIDMAVSVAEEIAKFDPTKIIPGAKSLLTTSAVFAMKPSARASKVGASIKRLNPVIRANQRTQIALAHTASAPQARKYAFRAATGTAGAAGLGIGYHRGKVKGREQMASGALIKNFGGARTAPTDVNSAKKERRLAHLGLAGNAVAVAGGSHALYLAAKSPALRGAKQAAVYAPKHAVQAAETAGKASKLGGKVGMAAKLGAAGWIGLHGAELGADLIGARAMNNQRKSANAVLAKQPKDSVAKAEEVDYTFTGEISKTDTHKRLAFGWCHLSEVDGQPHYDLQGDYAPIDEIEKSAYVYVQESRKGGDMHLRDGDGPKHTADLVESMVVTPEKLQKMGLSEEVAKSLPVGWWVGFKVNDDAQWQQVLNGERAGFSIHGKGARVSKVLSDA